MPLLVPVRTETYTPGPDAFKDAGSGAVTLLLRAGVPVEHWNLPLELAERPSHGATIDHDDVIDLLQAIALLPTADR